MGESIAMAREREREGGWKRRERLGVRKSSAMERER